MGKQLSCFVVLLVALIVVLNPGAAKADETWDFLQITCAPELNYFSLRTVAVERNNFVKGEKDLAGIHPCPKRCCAYISLALPTTVQRLFNH